MIKSGADIIIEDELEFAIYKEFLDDAKLYDRCLECDKQLDAPFVAEQVFCTRTCKIKHNRKLEKIVKFYKSKIKERQLQSWRVG